MYIAGFNTPGYLPNDTAEFDCFDDAKRFIIAEMKRDEDSAESEEAAENLCEAAEDVNIENAPFSVTVENVAYWVALA